MATKKSSEETPAPKKVTAKKAATKKASAAESEVKKATAPRASAKKAAAPIVADAPAVSPEQGLESPSAPSKNWQLHITLGDVVTPAGVKVIALQPAELSEEAIIEAITASGLKSADLRTKTVFNVNADPALAAALYAALLGFSGHRLDILTGAQLIEGSGVDAAIDSYAATLPPRGETSDDQVQVGAKHQELPSFGVDGQLDSTAAARIRHAHRVRFVPATSQSVEALGDTLTSLLTIAALRRRGRNERLPWLVKGNEPYEPELAEVKSKITTLTASSDEQIAAATEADSPRLVAVSKAAEEGSEAGVEVNFKTPKPIAEKGVVGIDLEGLRRKAENLRGGQRADDRGELVEAVAQTQRSARLAQAAALPIEDAIAKLGLHSDPVKGDFFCQNPRHRYPEGHTPTATLHIAKSKAQCHLCDAERLDSLRLVMSTRQLTPDDAADLLLK